jgi:hypothetical protein
VGDQQSSKNLSFRGVAMIAAAIGAVAVGEFAIGALTIRRLTVRCVLVGSAEFKSVEIQDLFVTRLRVAEVTVSDSLKLPGSNVDPKISSCKDANQLQIVEQNSDGGNRVTRIASVQGNPSRRSSHRDARRLVSSWFSNEKCAWV